MGIWSWHACKLYIYISSAMHIRLRMQYSVCSMLGIIGEVLHIISKIISCFNFSSIFVELFGFVSGFNFFSVLLFIVLYWLHLFLIFFFLIVFCQVFEYDCIINSTESFIEAHNNCICSHVVNKQHLHVRVKFAATKLNIIIHT